MTEDDRSVEDRRERQDVDNLPTDLFTTNPFETPSPGPAFVAPFVTYDDSGQVAHLAMPDSRREFFLLNPADGTYSISIDGQSKPITLRHVEYAVGEDGVGVVSYQTDNGKTIFEFDDGYKAVRESNGQVRWLHTSDLSKTIDPPEGKELPGRINQSTHEGNFLAVRAFRALMRGSDNVEIPDERKIEEERKADDQKWKQSHEKFLSAASTPQQRTEALTAMEDVLKRKAGNEAVELRKEIDTLKALESTLNLAASSSDYTVEHFARKFANPALADQAIVGLAAIANGSNGDHQQAKAAIEVLKSYIGRENPDHTKTPKVIDALLKSRTTAQADGFPGLVAASELASRTGLVTRDLQTAIQAALRSDTRNGRDAGFDALAALGAKAGDDEIRALNENMLPDQARKILSLPPELLARNDYALVREAASRLPDASTVFKTAADTLRANLTSLESAQPRNEALLAVTRGMLKASIRGLSEVARGANEDIREAGRAYEALKPFAENPSTRHMVIEAIASDQPPRTSEYWTITMLGRAIGSDKDGFDSIGKGLPAAEQEQLKRLVSTALDNALKSPAALENRYAANTLTWSPETMTQDVFNSFKNNLSLESINSMADYVPKLKAEQREELRRELISKASAEGESNRKARETAIMALTTFFGKEGLEAAGVNVRTESKPGTGDVVTVTDSKAGTTYTFIKSVDGGSKHLLPQKIERTGSDTTLPLKTEFKWKEEPNGPRTLTKPELTGVVETFAKDSNGNEVVLTRDGNYKLNEDATWRSFKNNGIAVPESRRAEFAEAMRAFNQKSDFGAIATNASMERAKTTDRPPTLKAVGPVETDQKSTDALRSINALQDLLKANPDNKAARDAIIALGGVKTPADDRKRLVEANLQALERSPDGLKVQLAAKDAASRMQALDRIGKLFAPGEGSNLPGTILDARIADLTKGVSPDSKPEVFGRLKERVQKDFEAALAVGDVALTNRLRDTYNRANTSQLIAEINNVTETDPAKASAEIARKVEQLLQQSQRGNPYSQLAVAMLINNGDRAAQEKTRESGRREKGMELPIPDLSKLTEAQRKNVETLATTMLVQKTGMVNGAISPAEAQAMTAAMLRAEQNNDSAKAKLFASALDVALSSKPVTIPRVGQEPLVIDGRAAAFAALGDTIKSGTTSEAVLQRYLVAASSEKDLAPKVKEDIAALQKSAAEGREGALRVLAGLAASEGTNANDARRAMIALASDDKTRVRALLAVLNARDSVTTNRDTAVALFKEMVAGMSLPPTVREALLSGLSSTNPEEKQARTRMLVAMAEHFKPEPETNRFLQALKTNMSKELGQALKELPDSVNHLQADQRTTRLQELQKQIGDTLAQVVTAENSTAQQKSAAIEALINVRGKQMLSDRNELTRLGITVTTEGGVSTLKHASSRSEFKVKEANNSLQTQEAKVFDANNKLISSRVNVFDERTGSLRSAEEIDSSGNRVLLDRNNKVTDVFRAQPSTEFIKISRTPDGKGASIYDNSGRGWDSIDAGKTWIRRGSSDKAYGEPRVQPDGSIKFSGNGPEGRVDVVLRPGGVVQRYDDARKETTVFKPDNTSVTTNEADKIVRMRDGRGFERQFFWSDDNKSLVGVKDETGLWQANADGTRWKNLHRPQDPEIVATRTVDQNGYKIQEAGKPSMQLRLDGSAVEMMSAQDKEIINRFGKSIRIQMDGAELKEISENGNVWRRKPGAPDDKALYLVKDGALTNVKATFEVSPDGTKVKRTLAEGVTDAKDSGNKTLFKEVEFNSNGTMVARDEHGRIRQTIGSAREVSTIDYIGDTDRVRTITTVAANGIEETTYLKDATKPEQGYWKTFKVPKSPGSTELVPLDPTKNFWNIGSLTVDKGSGAVIASNVRNIMEISSGTTVPSLVPDPRVRPGQEKIVVTHDQVVMSPTEGIIARERVGNGFRDTDRYSADGRRENISWKPDGSRADTSKVHNRDGSVATMDDKGQVVKVEGLANRGTLEIKRENGTVSIRESNGTRWDSFDGRTFINPATGQRVTGQLFVKPDGKYGFKIPGPGDATITRDPSKETTTFAPPERFGLRKLVPEATSISLHDNGSAIQLDAKGQAVAVANADGKIVTAKRDDKGAILELSITDPRTRQTINWKNEGGQLIQSRGSERVNLGRSKIELTPEGEVVQLSDRNKVEYVRKLDGTEIKRLEGSSEFNGRRDFRYVVERPDGNISEYHYRVHGDGPAENLEVIKTGTRNIDGSLKTDVVMRKVPRSDSNNPTWIYTDHPDIRSANMKMGQTWTGLQTFDPRTGGAESNGAIPGETPARVRTFADGWQQVGDSQHLTRTGPGGEVVRKNTQGQIESVMDRNGRTIDVKQKDGNFSEISITNKGERGPADKYTSENGRDWTRRYYDKESKQYKEEKFAGNVSVGADGTINIIKEGSRSVTIRPEGQTISRDLTTGTATIERTNGEKQRVGFGPNGKVNRLYNSDNSYSATDDGATWRQYDANGALKPGEPKLQKVEMDERTGRITIEAKDGSRVEIIGADGTRRTYEAVGPREQPLVMTYDRNDKGDETRVRYDKGKKLDTTVTNADKTEQKYNGDDLLVHVKDGRGKNLYLTWEGTPPRSTIKSFTDESGQTFVKEGNAYIARDSRNRMVDRFDGAVFVNSEGKLERAFGTNSNLIGQDRTATAVDVREIRGIDGTVLNLVGDKGITVRDHRGLLQRSIDGAGYVRQFKFDGTDRWGQPQLKKIIMGEGRGAYAYIRGDQTWKSDGSTATPKWYRSDDKPMYTGDDADSKAEQNIRVDHTTGDMIAYRNDFVTEHFNLSKGDWSTASDENVQAKAEAIKDISERWALFRPSYWSEGRFNDLNDQLKDLSADQIQAVKDYLMGKGLNITDYVNQKWSDGSKESVVLNGHLRRVGFTRDVHNVELAEIAIRRAQAEMAQRRGSGSVFNAEQELRDKIAPLNQRQLALLDRAYAADHDGKTVLEDMRDDPAWKRRSELHRTAMETYLTFGKGNRTPEQDLELARMAAQYLPANFSAGLKDDKSLAAVEAALWDEESKRVHYNEHHDSSSVVNAQVNAIRQQRLRLIQEFLGEGRVDEEVRRRFAQDRNLGRQILENGLLTSSQKRDDGNYVFRNGLTVGRNDAGRVMTLAIDAMNLGKVSEGTQLELGNWGTGNSNHDVEKIFKGMKEEDRRRVQLGMDIRMALNEVRNAPRNEEKIQAGKSIAERLQRGELRAADLTPRDKWELAHFRREEAQKLLADPEKGFVATAALASYDQLYEVAGRQSMFSSRNERFRREYLQSAAGAGFAQEMGDKNISLMWWNASKDEHMRSVEHIDERSLMLLSSNRNLRELNSLYMRDNFNYDRGNAARKLLDDKLNLAGDLLAGRDNIRLGRAFDQPQTATLRELLPGTRNLSEAEFKKLIDQRTLDKDVESGQALRDQINRGRQLEQMLAYGAELQRAITAGTKVASQLNTRDADILALYQRSQKRDSELNPAEKIAEAKVKADLQKFKDSNENKLTPDEKKALERYELYQSWQKVEEKVADGRRLNKSIEAGRQLFELANKSGSQLNLNDEQKAQLALYDKFKNGGLSEAEKQNLDLFHFWQRKQGVELARQFKDGASIAADLEGRDPASRAEARQKLTQEQRADLNKFLDLKAGTQLNAKIEQGRDVSQSILEGKLRESGLTTEQKERLSLFKLYEAGRLPKSDALLLDQFKAFQREQGEQINAQFSRGEQIARTLEGKTGRERTDAVRVLTKEAQADLQAFESVNAGRQSVARIEEGRKLADGIANGSIKPDTLYPDQKKQLETYTNLRDGKLSQEELRALISFEARQTVQRMPSASEPTGRDADALKQSLDGLQALTALQRYREDNTGLKAFLDGRDVARRLDGMSVSAQTDLMRQLEQEPTKANEKHALEAYRRTVYEIARDNVRRDISEVITDVDHYFSRDYKALFDAIVAMKPAEREKYAKDAEYREKIDSAVERLLSSRPNALNAAEHLLRQIKENPDKPPVKDVVFDLFSKAQDGKRSAREAAYSIQSAVNGPDGELIKRKLDSKSPDYDRQFARSFEEAWQAHFPLSHQTNAIKANESGPIVTQADFKARVLGPLLEHGHLSIATIRSMHGDVVDQKHVAAELLKLNERSRAHMLATDKDNLSKIFTGGTKQFVETILSDPNKPGVADKLRALHLGVLKVEELSKVLGEIRTMDERRHVVNEYARKYNGDAVTHMRDIASSADQGKVELALRNRDMTALEQLYKAQDHTLRVTGTGWDTRGWNSSAYQLDNRIGELTRLIGGDNARFRETDQARIDEYMHGVWDAQDSVVAAQKEQANLAREIAIGVAATVLTIGSGGTMSWAAIALFTMSAAGGSAAITAAAMGGNARTRDLVEAAKDGAKSALIQSIGPGHIQKLTGFGSQAAGKAAEQILKEAAFKGLSEAEKRIVQQQIEAQVVKMLRQGAQNASMKGMDQQINHAVMEVLKKNPATKKIMEGMEQQALVALERSFNTAAKDAISKLGQHYVESEANRTLTRLGNFALREGRGYLLSHGAASLTSLATETADLFFTGRLNTSNIMDGSFLTDRSIMDHYYKSLRGANMAAFAGHTAGRAAHHLVNSETIAGRLAASHQLDPATMRMVATGIMSEQSARLLGNAAHFTSSGIFMVGGMAGANWLGAGIDNIVEGKVAAPTDTMASFIQFGIAPFLTGVHGTFEAARRAPIGRPRYELHPEATVKPTEPLRGAQTHEKPVVKYESPTLENTKFEKPAVVENGKGTVSSGTVELRGEHTKVRANVPEGETLRIVVNDPAALKNFEIAPESKGKVEFFIPEGHPAARELLLAHLKGIAEGKVELKTLTTRGEPRLLVNRETAQELARQLESGPRTVEVARLLENPTRPEATRVTEAELHDFRRNFPGLSDAALLDLHNRITEVQKQWTTNDQLAEQAGRARKHADTAGEAYLEIMNRLSGEKANEGKSAAEMQRLVQQTIKDAEKNSNHPLHKEAQRFTEARTAFSEANREISQVANERAAQLKDAYDAFAKAHSLPPLDIVAVPRVTDSGPGGIGQSGSYRFGEGKISIPMDLLAGRASSETLLKTLFHEGGVHGQQDRDIIALALNRSTGKTDSERIANVRKIYESLTGAPLNEKLAEAVYKSNTWQGEAWQGEAGAARAQRIERLASEVKNYNSDIGVQSAVLGNQERILTSRVNRLIESNNPADAVNYLMRQLSENGEGFRRALFPDGMVPPGIERLMNEWRTNAEGFQNHAELRNLLIEHMNSRLGTIRQIHSYLMDQYSGARLEREATVGERQLSTIMATDMTGRIESMIANKAPGDTVGNLTVEQWRQLTTMMREQLGAAQPNTERIGELARVIERLRELPATEAGKAREMARLLEAVRGLPADIPLPLERMTSNARSESDIRAYREMISGVLAHTEPNLRSAGIGLINELMRGATSLGTEAIQRTVNKFLELPAPQREALLSGLSRDLLTPASLRRFVELGDTARSAVSELLRGDNIKDARTFDRLVSSPHVELLESSLRAGLLDKNMLADALVLKGSHLDRFMQLLGAQTELPVAGRMKIADVIKRLAQDVRGTLTDQVANFFTDNTIARNNFDRLFAQFTESADRNIALELMRLAGENLTTHGLNDHIASIGDQLQKAIPEADLPKNDKGKPVWTILVPDGVDPANSLAHLMLRNSGVEVRVEVVSKARMAELAKEPKVLSHAIVLGDLNSFSPDQRALLKSHVGRLHVAEVPGFNKGMTVFDLASTGASGPEGAQRKLRDLVHQVNELRAQNSSLTEAAAIRQVLFGNVQDQVTGLKHPDAHVVRSTHQHPTLAGQDALFSHINQSLTTPQRVESFLALMGANNREAAGRILRDGVIYNSYATMMQQSRDLHQQIVARNGGKNVLIVTGLEPNGSQYLVNHLYAQTNGLGKENFISIHELNALRDRIANLKKGQTLGKDDIALLRLLEGSTLAYIDDYVNSGTQTARLISDAQQNTFRGLTLEGKPVIKDVVVGSLGKYDVGLDAQTNPWHPQNNDSRFEPMRRLGVRLLSANTYHSFDSPTYGRATGLDVGFEPRLGRIGGGAAWSSSSVETTIVTPYGGPNNNVRFIQAFVEGFGRGPQGALHPGPLGLPARYRDGFGYSPPL